MANEGPDNVIEASRLRQVKNVAGALIEGLGETLDVSRAYIFRFDRGERLLVSQTHEWVAPGVTPQIDNPDLQRMDLEAVGFGRWGTELLENGIIAGPVDTFPEDEQPLLRAQDIQSLIVVPIWHRGQAWGFLGFDDCQAPRAWTRVERDALRQGADLLGEVLDEKRVSSMARHAVDPR